MTDQDHRVQCVACAHYVRGWCQNALKAGLSRTQPEAQVSCKLAVLKQDCKGFALKGEKK